MRKNLTISLPPNDWTLVQQAAKALGVTLSGLFHRLIKESLSGAEADPKIVAKYRPLFKADKNFLVSRADAFMKAGRQIRKPTA